GGHFFHDMFFSQKRGLSERELSRTAQMRMAERTHPADHAAQLNQSIVNTHSTYFMIRLLVLLYAVLGYGLFFAPFLYMIGFVENLVVPKCIDGEPQVPLTTALLINAALLSLFAVQHSVLARPAFKRWWTKFVPEPIERSTFVLFTRICLITMV